MSLSSLLFRAYRPFSSRDSHRNEQLAQSYSADGQFQDPISQYYFNDLLRDDDSPTSTVLVSMGSKDGKNHQWLLPCRFSNPTVFQAVMDTLRGQRKMPTHISLFTDTSTYSNDSLELYLGLNPQMYQHSLYRGDLTAPNIKKQMEIVQAVIDSGRIGRYDPNDKHGLEGQTVVSPEPLLAVKYFLENENRSVEGKSSVPGCLWIIRPEVLQKYKLHPDPVFGVHQGIWIEGRPSLEDVRYLLVTPELKERIFQIYPHDKKIDAHRTLGDLIVAINTSNTRRTYENVASFIVDLSNQQEIRDDRSGVPELFTDDFPKFVIETNSSPRLAKRFQDLDKKSEYRYLKKL